MDSKLYEENFSCTVELAQTEEEPTLYETYGELICHYYICLGLHPSCENVISLKPWVEYLFPIVDGPIENI